jgi:hypothetical protein
MDRLEALEPLSWRIGRIGWHFSGGALLRESSKLWSR